MAAIKRKCLQLMLLDRTVISKATGMFLGTASSMACRPTPDVRPAVWKSNMAALKQEVVIILVVYQM